jgi:hypothetical protein
VNQLRHLMLEELRRRNFADRRGLTKVASFCSPEQEWKLSILITLNAARCQTLYRLNNQE